jgi:hypothetical protein
MKVEVMGLRERLSRMVNRKAKMSLEFVSKLVIEALSTQPP